jgi:hypothetical protein
VKQEKVSVAITKSNTQMQKEEQATARKQQQQ